jgi:hypothetical protein
MIGTGKTGNNPRKVNRVHSQEDVLCNPKDIEKESNMKDKSFKDL